MRWIGVASLVFLFYALIHFALFVWAMRLFLRHRQPATVPLLIVTFGLIYDNVVLAGGASIGHGDLLERLSVPRYFMHAFGAPLLMLSALGIVQRARDGWARNNIATGSVAALTVAMIVVGVDADFLRLDLVAEETDGVLSYGNASTAGPPIAPIVTILVLIAAGVIVWWRHGGPWLLTGALAQFGAAATGDAIVIATNFGELALLAGLLVTDASLSTRAAPSQQSR